METRTTDDPKAMLRGLVVTLRLPPMVKSPLSTDFLREIADVIEAPRRHRRMIAAERHVAVR